LSPLRIVRRSWELGFVANPVKEVFTKLQPVKTDSVRLAGDDTVECRVPRLNCGSVRSLRGVFTRCIFASPYTQSLVIHRPVTFGPNDGLDLTV
jgi:hypothetical protein